jgi:hypothetical protein
MLPINKPLKNTDKNKAMARPSQRVPLTLLPSWFALGRSISTLFVIEVDNVIDLIHLDYKGGEHPRMQSEPLPSFASMWHTTVTGQIENVRNMQMDNLSIYYI